MKLYYTLLLFILFSCESREDYAVINFMNIANEDLASFDTIRLEELRVEYIDFKRKEMVIYSTKDSVLIREMVDNLVIYEHLEWCVYCQEKLYQEENYEENCDLKRNMFLTIKGVKGSYYNHGFPFCKKHLGNLEDYLPKLEKEVSAYEHPDFHNWIIQ